MLAQVSELSGASGDGAATPSPQSFVSPAARWFLSPAVTDVLGQEGIHNTAG